MQMTENPTETYKKLQLTLGKKPQSFMVKNEKCREEDLAGHSGLNSMSQSFSPVLAPFSNRRFSHGGRTVTHNPKPS